MILVKEKKKKTYFVVYFLRLDSLDQLVGSIELFKESRNIFKILIILLKKCVVVIYF